MTPISIFVALGAGLVSFLSPCVLPIIPGFLAYLSGASAGSSRENAPSRWNIFIQSVFFVIGFSIVFALLGVLLNTVLESFAYTAQTWFARIGGAIVIFFGLYLAHIIRIPFLERAHTMKVRKFGSRHLTSLLFGAAFAAGWTPCVGAALGAILGLAATAPGSAFTLLLSYSIGLGIPFLVVGFFTAQAQAFIGRHTKAFLYIQVVFGVILIALGVLVFTESLSLIANFSLLNSFLLK